MIIRKWYSTFSRVLMGGCVAMTVMMANGVDGNQGSFPRLIVCDGNGTLNAEAMTELRSLGVEAINFDINWSVLEPEPGVYDWTAVDRYVADAQAADMPLYAGLAFHYAPTWLDDEGKGLVNQFGDNSLFLRPSRRYPNIWHPEIRALFQRTIEAIGERYGDDFEAVFVSAGELGELQFIGAVPGRPSFSFIWAFDPHAITSFREFIRARYDEVNDYARKRGMTMESFEDVLPPRTVQEALADVDFLEWKFGSLVDNAEFMTHQAARFWSRIGIKHNVAVGHNHLYASTGTGSHTTGWIGEIAERVRDEAEVFACWGMAILPMSWYGTQVAHQHGIKFMNEHAILDLPAALSWSEKAGIDTFSYFHAGSLYDPQNRPLPKLEEFRWFVTEWLQTDTEAPGTRPAMKLHQHHAVCRIEHPSYEAVLGSDFPTAGMLMSLKPRHADGSLGENPLVAFSPATAWRDGVPYAQMRATEEESAPRVLRNTAEEIVLEVTGTLRNAIGRTAGWDYRVQYTFRSDQPDIEIEAEWLPQPDAEEPDRFGAWLLAWPPIADTVTSDFINLATGVDGPQTPRPAHLVAIEGQDLNGLALSADVTAAPAYVAGPHRGRDDFDTLGFPQRNFHMWMAPPANYFVKELVYFPEDGTRTFRFSVRPYTHDIRWQVGAKARPVRLLTETPAKVLTPDDPEGHVEWILWNRSGDAVDVPLEVRSGERARSLTRTLPAYSRTPLSIPVTYTPGAGQQDYTLTVESLPYPLASSIRVEHRHRIPVFSAAEEPFIVHDGSFRTANQRFTDRTAYMVYRFPATLLPRGRIRLHIGQQYHVEATAENTDRVVEATTDRNARMGWVELDVSALTAAADAVTLTIRDHTPADGHGALWEYIELE